MDSGSTIESQHFDCECTYFMHVFRFNIDNEDGTVWLDVHISPEVPWHKRIWLAVKYVFSAKPPAYGHYDCTRLRFEDYDRIREILKRSEIAKAAWHARRRDRRLLSDQISDG